MDQEEKVTKAESLRASVKRKLRRSSRMERKGSTTSQKWEKAGLFWRRFLGNSTKFWPFFRLFVIFLLHRLFFFSWSSRQRYLIWKFWQEFCNHWKAFLAGVSCLSGQKGLGNCKMVLFFYYPSILALQIKKKSQAGITMKTFQKLKYWPG